MGLELFFFDILSEPLSWSSDSAMAYVVGMMCSFASRPLIDGPLCLELAYMGRDRIVRLQEMGDQALFVSGFFPERLEHLGLRVGYYESLGATAYSEVSSRHPPGSGRVLAELASQFGRFRRGVRAARRACDLEAGGHDILARHAPWRGHG